MKNISRIVLFTTICLSAVSAFSQIVIGEANFSAETLGNNYILPDNKLLMLNVTRNDVNISAKFEIYDSQLNLISNSEIGIREVGPQILGQLSADSSKFFFIKFPFNLSKIEVVTVELKDHSKETVFYKRNENFKIPTEFGAKPAIIVNDRLYVPGVLKSNSISSLWQIDLNSESSIFEEIPGLKKDETYNTFDTWENNSPMACYAIKNKKEKSKTFHFLDLQQGGPMKDMHFTAPADYEGFTTSMKIYKTGKSEYVATGSCGPTYSNAIFFVPIQNHQASEMRRLYLCDIPKFESAVKYIPIEKNEKNFPGTMKEYKTIASPSAMLKTKDGYFLGYRMLQVISQTSGIYFTHDQLLKVDSDFELLDAQFIQYQKGDAINLKCVEYSYKKDGSVTYSICDSQSAYVYSYKNKELSQPKILDFAALETKQNILARFSMMHWHEDNFLIFKENRDKSKLYSVEFE
jgi:hypothetical protein